MITDFLISLCDLVGNLRRRLRVGKGIVAGEICYSKSTSHIELYLPNVDKLITCIIIIELEQRVGE